MTGIVSAQSDKGQLARTNSFVMSSTLFGFQIIIFKMNILVQMKTSKILNRSNSNLATWQDFGGHMSTFVWESFRAHFVNLVTSYRIMSGSIKKNIFFKLCL